MPYTLNSYSSGIKNCLFLFLFVVCGFSYSFSQNAIVTENLLPGVPSTTWDIPNNFDGSYGDASINGFATDISVNKGGSISFKVSVTTGTDLQFGIQIYRLGYYGGNGARLIADLGGPTTFTGITQAACSFDGVTGLTDCGNWTTTTTWNVPANVVSGYYLAKLTRNAGGGSCHIAFIVRDDANAAPIFFKASDATWQAYNNYGGASLYVGAGLPNSHASKVSYNRPFLTRNGLGGGGSAEDWLMNSEYPMIRFMEANGFNMTYTTDVDIARTSPNPILSHRAFLSVGHDEYWSKPERDNVEAAKAAGIHLAFFSGNEVYWKTRWENSVDGTNTPFRTLVCYKEGKMPTPQENACGGKCDPTPEWTGLWRDGCSFPAGNACKPENALSGQISWSGTTGAITVPDTYKNIRFWRNTPVAALASGQTATLTAGTLGYEWDWYQFPTFYPAGRMRMSNTALNGHIHNLSLYKSSFGGWVFGAGTVQWTWGLDANHDRGSAAPDISMQQATINLFADMGIQPGSLQPG
ncbi:MAG TPA: N,N-dimethylformamidase beta subunit family domain-containing protein, partial [Puia sp.]